MSTVKFEPAPLPAHAQATSEGPRKKRKRAPAQGAADDCFTCSGRNLKCDRRRPYCSQCLDGGQDCAGYKTQLTWGVGVASRGKLRGLSLPVAGTTKISSDATTSSSRSGKRATNSNTGSDISTPSPRSAAPSLSSPQPISTNGNCFRISVSQPPIPNHQETQPVPLLPARGSTRQAPPYGIQVNTSQLPLSVYNTLNGISPTSAAYSQNTNLSPTYEKVPHGQLLPYPTPSPTNQHFQVCLPQHQLPPTPTTHSYHASSEHVMVSQSGYHQATPRPYSGPHDYVGQPAYAANLSLPDLVIPNSKAPTAIEDGIEDDIEEIKRELSNDGAISNGLVSKLSSIPMDSSLSFPLSGFSAVGKTPRMQYLIQYYAEVISPVIVAFDSDSNPLRNQLLSLAARSESLQHAISALSASNIRQRQESGALSTGKTPGARRSSYMHVSLTNEAWDDAQNLTMQDRKREESLHQYAAIRMLNQQLAHPVLRKDDSVLATLLMLCLFHICDSGIAKFQTQFAGVKKLLNLRGTNFKGPNGDTKWMARIFTFFDVVAATVNDREGQIDGQFVDISADGDGQWPYETLSGVDSRLFKPLSRLGRLNVLSQGKSTESNPTLVSRPLPTMSHVQGQQYNGTSTFDGNGWMRILSDEDLFSMKTAASGAREQFWREWREVRQDLQTWSFDNTRFDGSDPSQPYLTPDQRFDMCSISESFRYSALLYTERLADPTVPSTHQKIQDWVQRSLYHINHVRADVYLLWPLFITGAECGLEEERNVIRERCLDIQKDSGFMNNSSCLTLLEKVWRGDGAADTQSKNRSQQANTFKFRDVMLAEGNEGEWIVV